MKRSHLKRFSAARVHPRSASGIDQHKMLSYEIFQNRQRVETTIGPKHNCTPLGKLDNTFLQDIPKTRGPIAKLEEELPRDAVKARIKHPPMRGLQFVWQSDTRQGFDTFDYFTVIHDIGGCCLKMYHCGDKICFLKEYPELRLRSLVFNKKELGLKALAENKIKWIIYDP